MANTFSNLNRILKAVENLEFDSDSIKGQEVNQEVVDWYSSRFDMLINDGVPSAINCYLQKLNKDSVNDATRLSVMHEALNKQLKKG